MTAKDYLLVALAIMTVFFLVVVVGSVTKARAKAAGAGEAAPSLATIVVGFVTNFFDTFGIGSFATTTAIFRRWKMIRDEHIPGTLNAGHTLPTVVQAVIFTRIVPVDSRTLILMIAAAVSGAWLGAGFVARWPRARIQLEIGRAHV